MASNALLKILLLEGSRLKPVEIDEYLKIAPQALPWKFRPKNDLILVLFIQLSKSAMA